MVSVLSQQKTPVVHSECELAFASDRINDQRTPRRWGVTDRPGTAPFYEVADSGLSTMDAALAASHADAGRQVTEQTLECVTLDSILAQYAPATIHFLKVDVEGAELQVLRGLSLQKYRPWVLVIEARAPNSDIETHEAWEADVLAAGYRFVYQDGLNRFYLAGEHGDRASAFAAPPNVLDGFIRYGEWRVRHDLALLRVESEDRSKQIGQWSARAAELSDHIERLQQLADARSAEIADRDLKIADRDSKIADRDSKIADRESKLITLKAALMEASSELQSRETLLAQILSSRSWRLTRPLRVAGRLLRHGPDRLTADVQRLGPRQQRLVLAVLHLAPWWRKRVMQSPQGVPGRLSARSRPPVGLSDKGEMVLAAMDRARGRMTPGSEQH